MDQSRPSGGEVQRKPLLPLPGPSALGPGVQLAVRWLGLVWWPLVDAATPGRARSAEESRAALLHVLDNMQSSGCPGYTERPSRPTCAPAGFPMRRAAFFKPLTEGSRDRQLAKCSMQAALLGDVLPPAPCRAQHSTKQGNLASPVGTPQTPKRPAARREMPQRAQQHIRTPGNRAIVDPWTFGPRRRKREKEKKNMHQAQLVPSRQRNVGNAGLSFVVPAPQPVPGERDHPWMSGPARGWSNNASACEQPVAVSPRFNAPPPPGELQLLAAISLVGDETLGGAHLTDGAARLLDATSSLLPRVPPR
ncbi:hypothetical protein VFPFJ_05722 [Purpureocillium lilacinum]|uniref:Uncharacterized protein n=1 Tax=Purpureocillium lilacinum TaxID=33203 RepID=A0A179HIM0_PURLI|nr:hypothetical protein VFPFJ_05722 [Purpureocillium lilacinum]OAQ89313.1 hypothetical protein VFPFJ_05722 [Purpureocillium lilacinum]